MAEARLFEGLYDPHPSHPETTPRRLSEKYHEIKANNLVGVPPIHPGYTTIALKWLVSTGEPVERGQPLLTVFTLNTVLCPCHIASIFVSPVSGVMDDVFITGDEDYLPNSRFGRVSYDTQEEGNTEPLPLGFKIWGAEVDRDACVAFGYLNKPGRDLEEERKEQNCDRIFVSFAHSYIKNRVRYMRQDAQDNIDRLADEINQIEKSKQGEIKQLEAAKMDAIALSRDYAKKTMAVGAGLLATMLALGWAVAGLVPSAEMPATGIIWSIICIAVAATQFKKFRADYSHSEHERYDWDHQFPDESKRLAEAKEELGSWKKTLEDLG